MTLDHHERRSILFFLEWTLTLDMDYSPCMQCLSQNSIYGLIECFIHHIGILHSIGSDKGSYFTANKVTIVMEFFSFPMFPIILLLLA